MKKILSFLLACVLFTSSIGIVAQASPVESNVTYTLAGYDIIDANEVVNMNEPVTRGEFAGMVTRLMCINESAAQYTETSYWDVPADYKYASDISILTAIGIFSGFSDTMFGPNEYVTYEQALKILVLITGYGEIALKNGGWPKGYEIMATKNRMLGGVTLSNPFSRAQLYKLIYNTLDVKLLGDVIKRGEDELAKTSDTIRSQIANKIQYELYRHKGVIVANPYTYTTAPFSDLYDDEVVINNRTVGDTFIYSVGSTNAFDLVGCEVDFYARKSDTGYELLSVRPTINNEVVEVQAEDFGAKNGNKISYSINDNHKTLDLEGDYKVIVNGNRIMKPTDSVFDFADGYITFINNDADEYFEIALIWKYENAIATSFDGMKMEFANDAQYRKRTSLAIEKDNRDVKFVVTDKDGNAVESFDTERLVSIFANDDYTRYRIVVSDEIFDGTITKISKNSCFINEKEYGFASSLGEIKFNVPYQFYIDFSGKLAFAKIPDERNYGYIMEYAGGFLTPVQVKMIIPGKIDNGYTETQVDGIIEKKLTDLVMQNDSVQVFDFADKIRGNGKTYQKDEIIDLLERNGMKAVEYKLNDDGKISEINALEKCGGDINDRYQYNVNNMIFGGTMVDESTGFALDYETLSACIPVDENDNVNYNASEGDLAVKVYISAANNDVGFRVEGYDLDPATKKARFIVTYAYMNEEQVKGLEVFGSTPSIVVNEYVDFNEETNENVRVVELLENGTLVTLTAMPITNSNREIEQLKIGDIISYSKNNNGLLSNVYIYGSLPNIAGYDYYETVSDHARKTVGKVKEISFDKIDTYKMSFFTKIDLYLNDSGGMRTFKAPQNKASRSTIPIYIYDVDDETYASATLQDIIPEYDKLLILENDGDTTVKTIVIIR